MRRWSITALLLTLLAAGMLAPRLSQAQAGPLCFPEAPKITNCIEGRFREYWEQNGGLLVFGYPISAATNEVNRDTGQTYLTQWFERHRFELHPENRPPYDVLLGRLGEDRLIQMGVTWQQLQPEPRKPGCLFFEETGRNVCDQSPGQGFMTWWLTHGLQVNRLGAYERSLALLGLPLTIMSSETTPASGTVLTQWFERGRLEWHPTRPEEFRVLPGLLGTEVRTGGAPTPDGPPAPPQPAP